MLIAGRYRIIQQLEQSAFSLTYQVEDTALPGNPLRILRQLEIPINQPLQVEQGLEQQASNLGNWGNSEQRLKIVDCFQENSRWYLVQELIETNPIETELNQAQQSPPLLNSSHLPSPHPQTPRFPALSSSRLTRRRLIQLTGLGSAGLMGALIHQRLFHSNAAQPSLVKRDTLQSPLSPTGSPPEISPGENPGKTLQSFSFEVITVNERGEETKRQSSQAAFFEEDLGNGVILTMVSIPGGTFKMGSHPSERGHQESESPQHLVSVQPFFMGKSVVTQAQWQQVIRYPKVERDLTSNPSHFVGPKLPVENVSWYDGVEFCQRLSRQTGRTYRLPSEAEWEYACRAGTTTPFHFGATITTDLANYDGNYTYASGPIGIKRAKTTAVESFPPNGFGLYDMHGNVYEWCADSWHDTDNGTPEKGDMGETNENDGSTLRGGSWLDNPYYCRSACRDLFNRRSFSNAFIGYRVVCVNPRTF